MTNPNYVLIDTCVVMEDPDVIPRIRARGGKPFMTITVLDELDYNKKGEDYINKNARRIFRELKNDPSKKLQSLPDGEPLHNGDVLSEFEYANGPLYLLARDQFRSNINNDSKIIEIAKDYGLVLITRDNAMKVRADALGVNAVIWVGPSGGKGQEISASKRSQCSDASKAQTKHHASVRESSNKIQPFALMVEPIAESDTLLNARFFPGTGDTVKTGAGRPIVLGNNLSAGGEGTIYVTDNDKEVCKIYHKSKLTILRKRKIELMVSREIRRDGLSWPKEIVLNKHDEFVGYIMPKAKGRTIQATMFVKPVLEKTFPNWRRTDLINICMAFLDHVRFLHDLNIVIGDINPLNVLVTDDSQQIWLVDTDSFQIENFPCPVGTVNFTPPEKQGESYNTYLRTKAHELFAVATLIFMILHPGKPPYSQQGGGSPGDNIKAMDFPYRFKRDEEEYGGKNVPQGPWQRIWSNTPYPVKEIFHDTFRDNKRPALSRWVSVMREYRKIINAGRSSDELFPMGFKVLDPIDAQCASCGAIYTESKEWLEKLQAQNKECWCPACSNQVKLKRLASASLRANERNSTLGVPKPYSHGNSRAPRIPTMSHANSGGQYGGRQQYSSQAQSSRLSGNTTRPWGVFKSFVIWGLLIWFLFKYFGDA
jgi:serine/threonine protein kinase